MGNTFIYFSDWQQQLPCREKACNYQTHLKGESNALVLNELQKISISIQVALCRNKTSKLVTFLC